MKHYFLLLSAVLLTAGLTHAQSGAFDGLIEKYKSDPAFTYAFLSKDLFEVVSRADMEDKDWKKLQNVVRNIGTLSILVGDSLPDALPIYREALSLVPTDAFDELLTVRDGQDKVRIWAAEANGTITDLVLLVGSTHDFVLICFAGNLELGNIAELAALFDADEAAQLARSTEAVSIDFAVSPNPASSEITVSYEDAQDVPAFLSVIDQSGRQVAQLELSGIPIQRVILPGLPAGTYWVQLKTREGKVGVKQVQIAR